MVRLRSPTQSKNDYREFYRCTDIDTARAMLGELIEHCKRPSMPAELRKLGRTLQRWSDKICNFHIARVSNGPTEALNNLIKRIKRIGYGFTQLPTTTGSEHCSTPANPTGRVLTSIVVR